MKKIHNIFIISLLCFSMQVVSQADYSTGIGLRGGFPTGVTIKHFVNEQDAIEGILGVHYRGFVLTGLYERHINAFGEDRLNFYYGAGGHVGFWSYYKNHPVFNDSYSGTRTIIGVDGILGLEYSFEQVPFNLSVDWKPMFNLGPYSGFWADSGALSIRYIW